MSDTHAHFLGFEHEITPSIAELERLLVIRRRARKAIKYHCATLGVPVRFHPQGSFRLLTAVRRDGLDLDDGVLFSRDAFRSRPSVHALQEIVFDGLHAAGLPVFARQPCLRILYPRGVRLDLVAYLEDVDGQVSLAHQRDGWVAAHSSHLIAWFENPMDAQDAGQMRRLIKYYKFWAARLAPVAAPSGVAFTILIKTLHRASPRDDVALTRTMRRILEHLEAGYGCRRPTPPAGQELLEDEMTTIELERFLSALRHFVAVGEAALANDELDDSLVLWRTLFGPCFGVLEGEVTAEDRRRQLRRILKDFGGLPTGTAKSWAGEHGTRQRWTL